MSELHKSTTNDVSVFTDSISADLFASFSDREYRDAFAEQALLTFIPLQIRTIREQRGWTQTELGERCGGKAQGWISQLEDPNYGKFSLSTLRTVAKAFDCVLEVRFKSFRDYSDDQGRRRPDDTRVNSYDEDAKQEQVTKGARTHLLDETNSGNAVSGNTGRAVLTLVARTKTRTKKRDINEQETLMGLFLTEAGNAA